MGVPLREVREEEEEEEWGRVGEFQTGFCNHKLTDVD